MSRAPSAFLLYGLSERYRGSIYSKDVGGHSSCSLVSAVIWDSPARTAPDDDDRPGKDSNASSDLEQHNNIILCDSPASTAPVYDDRPVKDRNASSDLEQQNRTVEDQKAVRSCVVSLVGHSQKITSSRTTSKASEADPPIRRTWAVIHDAYLYRDSSATVLRIAPRDDDRPGKDKSAELDLVQQNRTVGVKNAVNSRIFSQVDDSQRMTSSRATPMVGEASDPIPQ
ncbi:hypothetical protein QAD02_021083 [Eretmocerus hayati]|uniref:Uncharacterized protein n=1 Tax=Eretmocerus hayati TaxID=131215 RepID=A0ACC2PU20_9HYME|nr:hypothetical protein QAD02_021083 [Eretmocerus hayati]